MPSSLEYRGWEKKSMRGKGTLKKKKKKKKKKLSREAAGNEEKKSRSQKGNLKPEIREAENYKEGQGKGRQKDFGQKHFREGWEGPGRIQGR